MQTIKYRGMRYRKLGLSGLWVSEVGLGLWKYGYPEYDGSRVGEHEAFKIFDRALELGITSWDTGNSYNLGSGNSERLIGRYFASRSGIREKVIMATKITNPVREEHEELVGADFTDGNFAPNQSGASRLYIMNAVNGCLKRLQTDYIDLLYLHNPNVDENGEYVTPLDETWGAMDDLVTQGKVRYLGVSNHTTDQIQNVVETLQEVGKDSSRRIIAVQNPYNLLQRDNISVMEERGDEQLFLRACGERNIGIVPYSPLASGALTGRYRRDNLDKVQGRIIDEKTQERYLTEYNLRVVEKLDEFVRQKGISMSQLAIAWLLSHEEVGSVIAGATRMEHLEDNAQATNVTLSQEDLERIEEIMEEAGEAS